MDIPLCFSIVGGVVSFWTSLYLASRTSYDPSTRLFRWALIILGVRFLIEALATDLNTANHLALPHVRFAVTSFALALWPAWTLGLYGFTPTSRLLRNAFLVAAACFTFFHFIPGMLANDSAAMLQSPLRPGALLLLFGLYVPGTLGTAWFAVWRRYRRERAPGARRGLQLLLGAASLAACSGVLLAVTQVVQRIEPFTVACTGMCRAIAAIADQAGHGALSIGIVLAGYGALTFTQRHTGGGRDYIASGLASFAIVGTYEGVLIALSLVMRNDALVPYLRILGVLLVPLVITTHVGLDQLRGALDYVRVAPSIRLLRRILRNMTRQAGANKPLEQAIAEFLRDLAQLMRISRVALFWFEGDTPRLLAYWGAKPPEMTMADLRMQLPGAPRGRAGSKPVLPIPTAQAQRGALCLGERETPGGRARFEQHYLELVGYLLTLYIERAQAETATTAQQRDLAGLQTGSASSYAAGQSRVAPVRITTVGSFNILVDGKPAKPQQAGIHMLKGMLMYLIVRIGERVSRDTLAAIAADHRKGRGAQNEDTDTNHLISRLRRNLQNWGMGEALTTENGTVTLHRHPSWTLDTDEALALYASACRDLEADRFASAIERLQQAFDGLSGDYMPEYVSSVYSIEYARSAWNRQRRDIARLLIDCYQQRGAPDDRQHILSVVERLLACGGDDLTMLGDARRIARECGDIRLAQRIDGRIRDLAGDDTNRRQS